MTPEQQAFDQERIRCRELLAEWMIDNSFATGHGDTIEDLLAELSWQVKKLNERLM